MGNGLGQTSNYQAKGAAHKSSMSQVGSALKQSSTRNLRTSSVSSQGQTLNRQKSSVSVNSNSGAFSSRMSNVKKPSSKIYNERMLSRAGSVTSTNSIGGARTGAGANRNVLQNSEK